MTLEEYIHEALKLGLPPQQVFDFARDFNLESLKNLLIAKGVFTKDEFDEFYSTTLKTRFELLKQLPRNK